MKLSSCTKGGLAIFMRVTGISKALHTALLLAILSITGAQAEGDFRQLIPTSSAGSSQAAFIEARNTQLALNPSTQVFAEHLVAQVSPSAQYPYPTLENLSSLHIQVDYARLLISPLTMQAMVTDELERAKAPLRVQAVGVTAQAIKLRGQIQRHGKWLNFEMTGKPERAGSTVIRLTPTTMSIRGTSLMPALLAADVRFAEIMQIQSKALQFDGRDMLLNIGALLPAPTMSFSLARVDLQEGAVVAVLADTENSPTEPPPSRLQCENQACPSSYLFANGGRLGALGVMLNQVPTLVTRQGTESLSLSLHEMEALLGQSLLRLRQDGAVWMQTPANLQRAAEQPSLPGQRVFQQLVSAYQPNEPDALLVAATNTELVTPQGVSIEVDHLLASTKGSELQRLPFLPQRALFGQIQVSFQSLQNLLNRVTFFYDGAPLRKFSVSHATANTLSLDLQSKPKLGPFPFIWSDTFLTGEVKIGPNKDTLEITPTHLKVFGITALPVLNALGLTLEDLIDISNRPDVSLKGNQLTLRLAQALPPLSVDTVINNIQIDPQAQRLLVDVGYVNNESGQKLKSSLKQLPPGMWVKASQLNAFGVSLNDTLSRVHTGNASRLTIELAQYPQVLSTGYLSMPTPGLVEVVLSPSSKQTTTKDKNHEF